jgi:hypothetical protein
MTAVAASSGGAMGDMKRPPGAQRTTTWVDSSERSSASVRVSSSPTSVVFSTATVTRMRPPKSSLVIHARPLTGPNAKSASASSRESSTRRSSPPCRHSTVAEKDSVPIAMHWSFSLAKVCGPPAAYAGG